MKTQQIENKTSVTARKDSPADDWNKSIKELNQDLREQPSLGLQVQCSAGSSVTVPLMNKDHVGVWIQLDDGPIPAHDPIHSSDKCWFPSIKACLWLYNTNTTNTNNPKLN